MNHRSARTALLAAAALTVSPFVPSAAQASGMPVMWPTCASPSDVECVESLSVTTESGTTTIADPGARAADPGTDPYVSVFKSTSASPAGQFEMVNFSVENPLDPIMGPGVYQGVADATYTFTLRLGATDPSFTRLAADPVSITPVRHSDGSFSITVTAKPKPFVSIMNTYAECVAGGWACQGEVGVERNVSGFVTSHPVAAMRDAVRGSWVATNASAFSTPQINIAAGTLTATAAGPHTVPDGFPTTGLTMEGGKALNPAFYKTFAPFTMLQAMLDRVPEELRSYITPETVSAKITELGQQRDQPVTVTVTEAGAIIDLGITHFSAPNPEITFRKPSAPTNTTPVSTPTTTAPSQTPAKPTVKAGKSFAATTFAKVPAGYKVVSVKVKSSSKKVCTVSGKKLVAKKPGKCSYTLTVVKGSKRKTVSGSATVS